VGGLPLYAFMARSVSSAVFNTLGAWRGWACRKSLVLLGMLTRVRTHSLSYYRSHGAFGYAVEIDAVPEGMPP